MAPSNPKTASFKTISPDKVSCSSKLDVASVSTLLGGPDMVFVTM